MILASGSRFVIAAQDQAWHWAEAIIHGKNVLVGSQSVPELVAARYAFSMNPEGCNFYNWERLRASPFRTDDWIVPPGASRELRAVLMRVFVIANLIQKGHHNGMNYRFVAPSGRRLSRACVAVVLTGASVGMAEAVKLSSLDLSKATQGWETTAANKSITGATLPIAGSDCYHLTPPPAPGVPEGGMGLQYLEPGRTGTVLMASRLEDGEERRTFHLRGLAPERVYGLTVDGAPGGSVPGAKLLREGFSVELKDQYRASILEFQSNP